MIIVTGAAGFIGSVLATELNRAGFDDLILVDRLRDGEKWRNLRGVRFRDYIHADDLFEPSIIDEFSEVKAIFHMGACSSTTSSFLRHCFSGPLKRVFHLFMPAQLPRMAMVNKVTMTIIQRWIN